MTPKLGRLVKAAFAGLIALFIGCLLCEFASEPKDGLRVDTSKFPPAAQAIMNERPGVPISPEQWKRLNKVLNEQGGLPSGQDIFLHSVRTSWYWFVALPLIGVGLTYMRWRAMRLPEWGLIFAPSLLMLSWSIAGA
ncbi:MAG: hypothetical protein ACOVO0_14040 [Burkholderiaceae bacterium]|jgi:hypothetical protein